MRERRPDDRRLAVEEPSAVESAVDAPPYELDEEAESEQAEHDGGHAGQVLDRQADEVHHARALRARIRACRSRSRPPAGSPRSSSAGPGRMSRRWPGKCLRRSFLPPAPCVRKSRLRRCTPWMRMLPRTMATMATMIDARRRRQRLQEHARKPRPVPHLRRPLQLLLQPPDPPVAEQVDREGQHEQKRADEKQHVIMRAARPPLRPSSAAIVAEKVRMESVGDSESTAAFPEAMSTIMVSPIALPNPRTQAARTPGIADGQHHAPRRLPVRCAHRQRALADRSAGPTRTHLPTPCRRSGSPPAPARSRP